MKRKNNNGTILIITSWVITLLAAIALSVTYRMRMELKLTGNEINKAKAYCAAKAGVVQALSVLNQDASAYDSLNEKWSNYSAELYGVNLFKDIHVGEGVFNVMYAYDRDLFSGSQQIFYGMQDEERKININKATQDVLESLPGMSSEIASSIRAWRGDADVTQDILLKEDMYYGGLEKPYKRKGKPFDCVEELLLVRGITQEMLSGKDLDSDGTINVNESGLSKYLTVYGDGLVNLNTADTTVLRAIGFTEDLVYKILRYRNGYDEILGTADDAVFTDVNSVSNAFSYTEPLTPEEDNLMNAKKVFLKVTSRYYMAYVEGGIAASSVKSCVVAILDKESEDGNQIVKWQE